MSRKELAVCFKSERDGKTVHFKGFERAELRAAVALARTLNQENTFRAEWVIQRGDKTILRMPRAHGARA